MSRCVILSAGPVEDSERLRPLLKKDDWIIAADGGGRLAAALGVKPAGLVADFDSSAPPDTGGDTEIVRLPMEKDWTDTQAAAMLALDRGYRDFLLLGCTGGRLDHTLANIAVLLYLLRNHRKAQVAVWALYSFLWDFVLVYLQLRGQPGFELSQMFTTYYEWFGVAAAVLMLAYNGMRGSGHKQLFYWFYPAHVYLLYGVSCLVYRLIA